MYTIEIPIGDYKFDKFKEYCEQFQCRLQKQKRGDVNFKIESDDYTNFFWLGANLNFKYESGISISSSSKYLG